MDAKKEIEKAALYEMSREAEMFPKAMAEIKNRYGELPIVTTLVAAQDLMSAWKADELVAGGTSPIKASNYIGSFSKLDWLIEKYEKGLLPMNWIWKDFPKAWVAADPIGKFSDYLKFWKRAYELNGSVTLYDDSRKKLPNKKMFQTIKVYTGKAVDSPLSESISWTTKIEVAEKFANGAAVRTRINGEVVTRYVHVSKVIAYLTTRGEYECIIDPIDVFE